MPKLPNSLPFLLLLYFLVSGFSLPARAAVRTVDDDLKEFPAAQFRSIHDALATAQSGDEIVVYPGHYYAPVHFNGKNVHLHSVDPADSEVVRQTVIDGQILDAAVIFTGDENETCVLEGFSIINGLSPTSGGGIRGGGTKACRATIRNNLIENNEAGAYGGGIANCSGLIINNTIRNNIALGGGGGLANCNSPGIQNNSILANQATEGGGLYACSGPIIKNNIASNVATNDGGGLKNCRGLIQDNSIRDNTAAEGAGLIFCSGQIIGNTLAGNTAANDGGALHTCNGTVRGNKIQSNKARNGAGLFNCDGSIEDNHLETNAARQAGGGLFNCDGTIRNNHLSGNSAKTFGGGIAGSQNVTIAMNRFESNQAREGAAIADTLGLITNNRFQANYGNRGGALIRCSGDVRNNLFAGNRAFDGAVMADSRGQFIQNTFAHNRLDSASGSAIELMEGCLFRNNIFYANDGVVFNLKTEDGNDPNLIFLFRNDFHGQALGLLQLDTDTIIETADVLNQLLDGCTENRLANPLFLDPEGPDGQADTIMDNDYHLSASSPAIDHATIHAFGLMPVNDLDGLGRWAGDAPDLGCFEFAHEPDADGDGLADERELVLGSDAGSPDTDGDGLIDSLEIRRGTSPTTADTGTGLIAPIDFPSLQETVLMAFNGEQVIVKPGFYYETVNLDTKSIRLMGENPTDPQTTEQTVIDAMRQGSVLSLSGNQDERMIIEGLTLRGGYAATGSAILGRGAPATLRHCIIIGNTALSGGTVQALDGPIADNRFENNDALRGGALADCPGPVTGNIMRGNSAHDDGGAIYHCEGEIQGNTIENNTAISDGGAIALGYGPIYLNTIQGNKAVRGGGLFQCNKAIYENLIQTNEARDGGGLYQCHGLIRDNQIMDNKAKEGGGFYQCHGEITTNTISGNKASYNGGGLYSCRASIHHNTISGNKAYTGGGLVLCDALIQFNDIIGNVAANNGGAIAASGKLIANNLLQGNQALNGGAIAFTDAPIHGNSIIDNSATNGGGVFQCNDLIDGNTLRGNTASQGGGAFSTSNGVIQNNLILGNIARRGGAMDQCHGAIGWNTIVGNDTQPGGIAGGLLNCAASLGNNIIAFNHNQALATDDAATTAPLITGNCFYNNWDGILLDPDGSRHFDLKEIQASHPNFVLNIHADPRFVDLLGLDKIFATFADGDFRLQPDSPGIDRSVPFDDEPATDQADVTRPLDGNGDGLAVSDLGALEFFAVSIRHPQGLDTLYAGGKIEIDWQNDLQWAGLALRFELWRDGRRIVVLGEDWNPMGQGTAVFILPLTLDPGGDYHLIAISTWNPSLRATRDALTILPPNTSARDAWMLYE